MIPQYILDIIVAVVEIVAILAGVIITANRLSGKVKNLDEKVSGIMAFLKIKFADFSEFSEALFKEKSPISLTPKSEDIVNQINANDILEQFLPKIKRELANEDNPYKIQQACIAFSVEKMKESVSPEILDKIQKSAFSNGVHEAQIFRIFGILLRDKIIKEKGLLISDIDGHAPKE